jgi:hypothetical protein
MAGGMCMAYDASHGDGLEGVTCKLDVVLSLGPFEVFMYNCMNNCMKVIMRCRRAPRSR